MLTDKVIQNKFYLYANTLHKVKKIHKSKNNVVLENMSDGSQISIPITGSDILLSRMYTIGEVAKIVSRRPDTIRKYERSGLIPKPFDFKEDYPSYKNWRFYSYPDVYEILDFFSDRSPGRPAKSTNSKDAVDTKIQNLNQKVKMKARNISNARI